MKGAYIYGDYSTGRIWAVKHDGTKILWHKELAITTLKITGFAFDPTGELLICHHGPAGDGGFFTLEPNPEKANTTFPREALRERPVRLGEGSPDEAGRDPVLGERPVLVRRHAQGAVPSRFPLARPSSSPALRGWNFPDKTVLVKSFALEEKEGDPTSRKWIETRFLTKQSGEWYGYSYVWNDDGTDATLIDAQGHGPRVHGEDRQRRAEADVALPEPGRVHGLP